MSIWIVAVVLLAAAMHAGWNALIKVSGDRLVMMAVYAFSGTVFSLLFVPFVEFPAPESRPLLGAAILLHTAYHLFLPIAYDHGDLGQVYPIARGSAPLLVAVGTLAFTDERLSLLAVLGVVCLASGVMALALERGGGSRNNPKAAALALVTGVLIASYTVTDGLGVRRAGTALGFAVWLTVGDGLLTFLVIALWKGRKTFAAAKGLFRTGVLGGAMQVAAYWIILGALAVAPMASVSALRETSVLFAALMSTFLLREGFGVWRFVSAALVTMGLVATKIGK